MSTASSTSRVPAFAAYRHRCAGRDACQSGSVHSHEMYSERSAPSTSITLKPSWSVADLVNVLIGAWSPFEGPIVRRKTWGGRAGVCHCPPNSRRLVRRAPPPTPLRDRFLP